MKLSTGLFCRQVLTEENAAINRKTIELSLDHFCSNFVAVKPDEPGENGKRVKLLAFLPVSKPENHKPILNFRLYDDLPCKTKVSIRYFCMNITIIYNSRLFAECKFFKI